jgi:hypothetical protein
MKIDTDLNKLDSNGERAMKIIKHFGRNYLSDKLTVCLLVLVAAALIGVIVICILKQKRYYVITK